VATLAVMAILGYHFATRFLTEEQPVIEEARDLPEILALIDYAYVDEVDLAELMPGAYQGALDRLDGRASYIPAGVKPRQLTENVYAKSGLVLSRRNGYAYVIAVAPGSPAHEAGIRAGAYLITINGATTRTESLYAVEQALSERETHELVVRQPDRLEDDRVSLTCRPFPASKLVVDTRDGVRTLGIAAFYPELGADLERELRTRAPDEHILLDLRNNAMGSIEDLKVLAGLFLPEGVIAKRIDARDQAIAVVNPEPPRFPELRPFLLVDASTSGAAEIFAAAASAQGFAQVIGQATLGLPTEYGDFRLREGSHIRIPVRKWVLDSGQILTWTGLEPHESFRRRTPRDDEDPLLTDAWRYLDGKTHDNR